MSETQIRLRLILLAKEPKVPAVLANIAYLKELLCNK